ncbi:putative ankyrin repeat-containing domain-containing protein [Helianthus anomalus]
MPKKDIDDILTGPRVQVQNKNKDKESELMPLIRTIFEKIDKEEAIPKSEIAKRYTTEWSYPSRVLFLATKMGNMLFVIELIRSNPDLIWKLDDKGKTIFHLAVKHRQINIYKLIYEIGAMKALITPIKDKKKAITCCTWSQRVLSKADFKMCLELLYK